MVTHRTIPNSALGVALLLLVGSCGGGGGGGGGGAAANVVYTTPAVVLRQGDVLTPDLPIVTGGTPTAFSILPALPTGLALDPLTGVISGSPLAPAFTATYTVTAAMPGGATSGAVSVQVTPPLPATFVSLEPGFHVETVLSGHPAMPVKMAFAPDGRLFFNELTTGNIRVIDPLGTLFPVPVATVSVITGVEQGLHGLALSPTFASDGLLYVRASVNVGGAGGDRNRVIRYTVGVNNAGTNPTVLVDNLPIGAGHNGGDLKFGPDGLLYTTTGDCQNTASAQDDLSLAGRVLRYTAAGGIPATNPIALSPEFCRGLRNTFTVCFHPIAGGLFGAENGPATNDEINFLLSGRNYDWPAAPGGSSITGYRVKLYPEVIAPTGMLFYTAAAYGAEYANNLFVGSYVNAEVRRLHMSGAAYTDVDYEKTFATLVIAGGTNKPIDLVVGPEGALYVSTFNAIYRIKKYP